LARLPACFLSGCLGPPRAPLFPYTTLFRSSPHSHYDFDQCSLIFEGNYIHHLRWPWSSNKHEWRADEHIEIGSPSVTIIPARVIHTSEAQAPGPKGNRMADIFAPPRLDFSLKEGLVRNADEYPIPEESLQGEPTKR